MTVFFMCAGLPGLLAVEPADGGPLSPPAVLSARLS